MKTCPKNLFLVPMLVAGLGLMLAGRLQAQFVFTTNNDGSLNVSGYTAPDNVVIIPGSTNSLAVTTIGTNAFQNDTNLTSVIITNGVAGIGAHAFDGCPSLTNVVMGTNVASLGDYVFHQCGSLAGIAIPASVTNLGNHALDNCSSLASAAIPDSVTMMGNYVFAQCGSLTNATIGGGVTNLGDFMFYQCGSLASATIGANVASLGNDVFYQCASLAGIVIPNSVTAIGTNAFYECASLTNVIIGTNVIGVGDGAFFQCGSLGGVTIPASVTNIGSFAFDDCNGLLAINVDTNNPAYSSVAGVLFDKSQSTLVQFPGGLGGSYVIPTGTTSIAADAFFDCTGLTNITAATNLASIGENAFAGCTNLVAANFQGNAPSADATVFSGDSGTVYYTPDTTGWTSTFGGLPTVLVLPPPLYTYTTNNGAITITGYLGSGGAVVIPGTITGLPVTAIGTNVFFDNTNLASVTITNSVLSIGADAFAGCPSLTNVTIGTNVTGIGDYAFTQCGSLPGLVIPGSVTNIGNFAFYQCGSLTNVTMDNGVINIGTDAFAHCGSLPGVTIPGSVANVGSNAFYQCGSLTGITLVSGVLNIGPGAFALCGSLPGVAIPGSITNIGDGAFYQCGSLTNVTLGNGVINIGNDAFYQCGSLPGVAIPDTVTAIGTNAFYQCGSLTGATLGAGVISIGDDAFYQCGSLARVAIPNRTTNIGNYAFYQCGSLTNVTIGTNVINIGADAFYQCGSITNLVIPPSVTSIGILAFDACNGLIAFNVDTNNPAYSSLAGVLFNKSRTTLIQYPGGLGGGYTVPGGVTAIATNAFYNCFRLTAVTIGPGVTNLGSGAFAGCTNLTAAYFQGNAASADSTVFSGDPATIYYLPGTTGWGPVFGGRPTAIMAPGSIAGKAIAIKVTGGSPPLFNGPGIALLLPANTGAGYTYLNISGLSASSGTETNVVTNSDILIAGNDSSLGLFVDDFTFTNSVSGTYLLTQHSLSQGVAGLSQNGSFILYSGQAPVSLAGKILDCTASGGGDTNFSISFSASGYTQVKGGTSETGAYSYSVLNTSAGKIRATKTGGTNVTTVYAAFSDANAGGFAVSDSSGDYEVGTFTVRDTTLPTLTVTAPTASQFWSNATFTAKGTANDNVAVSNVWYQLNGTGWNLATTTNRWTNWTASLSLQPSNNFFQAYALDPSGNHSSTSSVSFYYVVSDTLRVQTAGQGTVSPNYSNAVLQIGKSYTMTAAAAAGFTFTNWMISSNWVGNLASNKAALTFVMQSNLTLQANFVDTQKPAVAITAPTVNQFWSNLTFTATGTAHDNVAVSGVWYQLDGAGWIPATTTNGWTNWTANLTLAPSNNVLRAYAMDTAGNFSPTSSASFYYVVSDTLRIQATGHGTISPNYSNAVLQIGKSYTVTAAAAAGCTFTNWVVSTNWIGVVTTNRAALTFVMQSNLTLQANFSTNKPVITGQPAAATKLQGQVASFTVTATGFGLSYQWYAPTGVIAGATASSYTNLAVNLADAGSYSVIVTNTGGSVTSSVVRLTVNVDTIKPGVTISSPANLFETNGNTILVKGTATTSGGRISAVQVNVNGGGVTAASLTNSTPANAAWGLLVTNLLPGTNTVAVYATSFAGTNSAIVTNLYFFRVPMNLTLVTNGVGRAVVAPTPFYVNRTYTLTATAGANYLFSNVVALADSETASIPTNQFAFLGKSNVTLTVNFVTNLFTAAGGTYYGLFSDQTNGVSEASAGWFTIALTPGSSKQTFTASLFVDGDSLSGISGVFDVGGAVNNLAVPRKGKAPLTLSLQLNFDDTISGEVSDLTDGWVATLDGDRSVFGPASPSPYAGTYNLLIPGFGDPVAGPPGNGFATVKIAANGAVTASGSLADGQAFSPQTTTVGKNGDVPFYSKAYVYGFNTGSNVVTSYEGAVGGWLNFTVSSNGTPSGDLFWLKTGWTNGYYNGGFSNQVAVIGSAFTNVPTGLLISNGVVTLSGGDLTGNITDNVMLSNAVVKILAPTNQLAKLTITPSSGAVSGTFTNTADQKVETFSGLYLPAQNIAAGYFLGTNYQGGSLQLVPFVQSIRSNNIAGDLNTGLNGTGISGYVLDNLQ